MLSSDEERQYTGIIDAILATADLETITRKKIRQGLEKALNGKDLSEYKNEIKALIEERFDAFSQGPSAAPVAIPTPPSASALSDDKPHPTPKREHSSIKYEEDEKETNGEIKVSVSQPPAKKQKRNSIAAEDADARFAAELQAQENRLARGRTTRGGEKPAKPKKKAPKKKSAAKVKDDDSDAENSDGTPKEKRKAGGGFQKPFNLSAPLAELVGAPQMSRPQVVKHLWQHIKGNDLQDPSNKRTIICDDMMQAVFKQSRVDMFQMNKLLGDHLYPIEVEE